jgi:cellulose synthase/poly-beta-1,6-N-acetylglucosamine synthase-like glycosyltransferase
MRIVELGYRIRYAPDAKGWERAAATVRDELKRKVRIIAGGWQALAQMRSLLNPLRHPAIALQLISHKVLRWLIPLCLIAAAGSTLALLRSPFYRFAWECRRSSTRSRSPHSSCRVFGAAASATSRTISAR